MRPPRVGGPTVLLATARLQGPLDLALRVACGQVAPLVDPLLAAGERDLDLRAPVFPVHARGDDRQPALPHLAVEAVDLPAVEEQAAVARRPALLAVPPYVLLHLGSDEPGVAVADLRVGLRERHPAGAQRLDLRASEHE